jgi:hypothetical protein
VTRGLTERILIALAVGNLLVLVSEVLFHLARALSPPLPFR